MASFRRLLSLLWTFVFFYSFPSPFSCYSIIIFLSFSFFLEHLILKPEKFEWLRVQIEVRVRQLVRLYKETQGTALSLNLKDKYETETKLILVSSSKRFKASDGRFFQIRGGKDKNSPGSRILATKTFRVKSTHFLSKWGNTDFKR